MRTLWLIPDYAQSGVIFCIEDGRNRPLDEALGLASLPRELILGIPEEVLAANREADFVYAQFCRSGHDIYFACSVRAGSDRSGRTVVLTQLQLLTSAEAPLLIPQQLALLDGCAGEAMQSMALTLSDQHKAVRVRAMLQAVKQNPKLRSFASEPLRRAANPPQWMPAKKSSEICERLGSLQY